MAKPWFKFYVADFTEATYSWDPATVGVYIRLLAYQFSNKALPNDYKQLQRIAGCETHQEWLDAWKVIEPKFRSTEDGLVNEKMDKVRLTADRTYEARRKGAEAANKKRWSDRSATTQRNASASGSGSGSGSSSDSGSEKVKAIFDHYLTYHPKSKFTAARGKLIKARLGEGFTEADLRLAIDGNHRSPHHCGQNDRQTKYHGFELIFKNTKQVEMFIGHAEPGATMAVSDQELGNAQASQRFLEGDE